MFFLKPKHKTDELLPPPPPFPSMDFEEEKPVEEAVKPKKAEVKVLPEEKEFKELFKDAGEGLKPKKAKISKKEIKIQKPVLIKKPVKKIAPIKQIKEKKLIKLKKITPLKQVKLPIKKIEKIRMPFKKIKVSKKTIKRAAKIKQIKPKLEEDFGLKDIEFEQPQDLEISKKEIELPETLEELGIENVGKEFEQENKPKEILEAQEEIKSAIEKIKSQEKPSLFNRLFARKEKEKIEESYPALEVDKVSMIQDDIKKAREALMKFDLESAKMDYIEIMKLYSKIKPEEQAKVYRDIKDLYFERKSAEGLKV